MEYTDELISRYRKLHADRKMLDRQLDALADLILPELDDGERRSGVLVVGAVRKFSAQRAKEILTADDYDRICTQTPSAAKLREQFGDDVVELCRETSGKRSLRVSEI